MKFKAFLAAVLLVFISGCSSVYYKTMENLGYHKRDILVERVEDAKDSQHEAKDQFVSALAAFKAATNFDGGDLEKTYDRLNDVYEESAEKADAVRSDIDDVEEVSTALFVEWEKELELYSDATLKAQSKAAFNDARSRYKNLIAAMHRAESKISPVLTPLHDQVLFLKHNLNARAIQSLQANVIKVQVDVDALIIEMEKAIAEADEFIAAMK